MAQPGPSPNSDVSNVDGSVDFSGGVNSLKVTTIASEQNPNGLARNELAWLTNGTVRDGGITPRPGWKFKKALASGMLPFTGGFMYQPIDGSDPYLVFLIGGVVYRANVDDLGVINLITTAFVPNPSATPQITLSNWSLLFFPTSPPGYTIPVAADIQSIFGLPPTIPLPPGGISIAESFPLSGAISGTVGDSIVFYGSYTVQSLNISFSSSTGLWSASFVLLNQNDPPGIGGGFAGGRGFFGNPHGIPTTTGITNRLSGWAIPNWVSPAIGATVPLTLTTAGSVATISSYFSGLNHPTVLFFNGTRFCVFEVLSENVVYNSGAGQFVNTVQGRLVFSGSPVNGHIITNPMCGHTYNMPVGTPIASGPASFLNCSQVPNWIFDAFIAQNSGPAPGIINLIARQSAAPPPLIAGLPVNVGDTLNFAFTDATVINIRTGDFSAPTNFEAAFFCQGNEFLVVQAGDYKSLPLFWDGSLLRQSIGINNPAVAPGTPGVNELPPGGPMDFYMGRLWYSVGNNFQAGDISGGGSGTAIYNFRDAILDVTENPLVLGGDGFRTPSNEGNITALAHNANQDAALGQGRLFAYTQKGAHGLSVPVTRADWIAANSQNQPLLVPVQLANGAASDRAIVAVNGDLFYQSPNADIRTLLTAVRYFNQWGNIPISANVNRVIKFTDLSLLRFGTGIYFDNRLIQSTLPILTGQGVAHQAMTVLDFESISTFGDNLQPTWQGMYEGLDVLQLFTGAFSTGERAFAVVRSRIDGSIELWELTKDDRFDDINKRIQMMVEFPAFTWGNEFSLKQQISGEIWIDRLYGEVTFTLEYRPDGESCWQKWHEWKVCSPRNSCESTGVNNCTGLDQVQCYPLIPFGESYRQTMALPTPPEACSSASGRPSYINYQCQPRLTVKGFCRIRGLLLHATPKEKALYEGKVC